MAWPRISTGLRPRLPEAEAVPAAFTPRAPHASGPSLRARGPLRGTIVLLLLAVCVPTALAAGIDLPVPPDLLPNERAFAFSARAVDPRTVEVRFDIAPGYYLYRDKLKVTVAPGALGAPPAWPAGEIHRDEFFGESVTYRRTLDASVPLTGASPGRPVTVTAESQGCADAGVCYPPQRQSVTVTLPRAGSAPGPFVEAAPRKRGWF